VPRGDVQLGNQVEQLVRPYPFGVREEVQWYLAERLANARAMMGLDDALDRRHLTVAGFGSALDALRYVGELTEEEQKDWFDRMLVAVGITPPEPAPSGTARAIFVGNPKDLERRAATQRIVPIFERSIPGPDAEFDFHGGKLRVIATDIYDTAVDVRWRVAPEPDIDAVFPSEIAQMARDTEGTQDWAAEHLQNKGRTGLRMTRLYRFELSDDVGSPYMHSGGGHRGRPGEMTGEARFSPAPPTTASILTLTWHRLQVRVPLS
jgi:hypothetical protein